MHGSRRKVLPIKDKNRPCTTPQSALYFNCGKWCGQAQKYNGGNIDDY